MKEYRYLVKDTDITEYDLEMTLNDLGALGWELVTIIPKKNSLFYKLFLKKEV